MLMYGFYECGAGECGAGFSRVTAIPRSMNERCTSTRRAGVRSSLNNTYEQMMSKAPRMDRQHVTATTIKRLAGCSFPAAGGHSLLLAMLLHKWRRGRFFAHRSYDNLVKIDLLIRRRARRQILNNIVRVTTAGIDPASQ